MKGVFKRVNRPENVHCKKGYLPLKNERFTLKSVYLIKIRYFIHPFRVYIGSTTIF